MNCEGSFCFYFVDLINIYKKIYIGSFSFKIVMQALLREGKRKVSLSYHILDMCMPTERYLVRRTQHKMF